MKTVITTEIAAFIIANRLKYSRNDIATACGVSKSAVGYFLKKHNFVIPKEVSNQFKANKRKGKTSFTKAEDKFIQENYLKLPIKAIAKKLNRSGTGIRGRMDHYGLVIPKVIAAARKKKGMFRKGSIPPNKGKKQTEYMSKEAIAKTKATQFKKGQTPANKRHIGSQRITKDGYIEIKTAEPNKWELKHRVIFRKYYGSIPPGKIIVFRDGNKQNCKASNLEMISKAENVRRNHNSFLQLPSDLKQAITLTNKINKYGNEQHTSNA